MDRWILARPIFGVVYQGPLHATSKPSKQTGHLTGATLPRNEKHPLIPLLRRDLQQEGYINVMTRIRRVYIITILSNTKYIRDKLIPGARRVRYLDR